MFYKCLASLNVYLKYLIVRPRALMRLHVPGEHVLWNMAQYIFKKPSVRLQSACLCIPYVCLELLRYFRTDIWQYEVDSKRFKQY